MAEDRPMLPDVIVEISLVRAHSGFFAAFKAKTTTPPCPPGTELFSFSRDPGGKWLTRAVTEQSLHSASREDGQFAIVRTGAQESLIPFSAVATDSENHTWDISIRGKWRVFDAPQFLAGWALDTASPTLPVSRQMVESWMADRIATRVRDCVRQAVDEHGDVTTVRTRDVLPAAYWTSCLREWLRNDGVCFEVTQVPWHSEDAVTAEIERRRREDLANIEGKRREQREADLGKAREDAFYGQEKAKIAHDTSKSQKTREWELELLELEHRKRLLEAEREVQRTRQETERAAREHEKRMAELQNDTKAGDQLRQREEEARQRYEKAGASMEEAAKAFNTLRVLFSAGALPQLAAADPTVIAQSTERLSSTEFGVGYAGMAALGFTSPRQTLIVAAREKSAADNEAILLRKTDLLTRSVPRMRVEQGRARDLGSAPVQGLRIGSPVGFEFVSRREGYVTLLNAGTSGRVWLLVPNAHVFPADAKISAGRKYTVPGPELLPIPRLFEQGPAGWEHMVVIVSDEPLVSPDAIYTAMPDQPVVNLPAKEVDDLCQLLAARPPDTWSAGALSFLVVER